MCLAVPGRIEEVYEKDGLRMGRLDFGGVVKEVCLEYLPEAGPGDYAIVHVGFAISKLDEEAAAQTLEALREMGELDGPEWRPGDEDGAPAG